MKAENFESWDCYDSKMLESLVVRYAFDFELVADYFNRHTKHESCTAIQIRQKWAQISKRKSRPRSRFAQICQTLPDSRNSQNFLKVTREDLMKGESLQIDGTLKAPNGKVHNISTA